MTTPVRSGARTEQGAVAGAGRGDSKRAMVLLGSGCVILGGLVAAVTGPLGISNGSWLAAYLVLVCGVGSYAIGTMQARPALSPISSGWGWVQLGCWCAGNAALVAGAMAVRAGVVDVGVPLLVVALVIALTDDVHRSQVSGRWRSLAYRCLLVVLILSTPVGAVLAHVRGT